MAKLFVGRSWSERSKHHSNESDQRRKSHMSEPSVLIVDDDLSIRLMIAAVLTRAGMRVDTAATGREAVSRLEKHSYGAVVVDLAMPEIGGAEIVDRIAASGRKTKCVVLISAGSVSALNNIPERRSEEHTSELQSRPHLV